MTPTWPTNVIALTGHRPEKLKSIDVVMQETYRAFEEADPGLVITGMAAGFDLIGGNIALDMEIPIVCAKPWAGHTPRKGDEDAYERLIKYADEVVNVTDSENFPGAWCYHKRNEWMVDRADKVLACWDGNPGGGTYACRNYAIKKKVPVRVIYG